MDRSMASAGCFYNVPVPGPDLERQMEMLAALVEPGRRALYEFVLSRAPEEVSRDEAAQALGIPRALAAFHLDRLVQSRLLEPVYRRLSGRTGPGAGRPSKLYRRSGEEVLLSLPPRRYDLLALITVEALALHPGSVSLEGVCATARDVGRALGRSAGEEGDSLDAVSRALAEQGFEPLLGGGDTLLLRNCPFAGLAERFRTTVCAINLALHEGVLEGLGARGLRAELAPAPDRCCVAIHASALN
jgi:predicted ArsR family transcriptional regulator